MGEHKHISQSEIKKRQAQQLLDLKKIDNSVVGFFFFKVHDNHLTVNNE